MTGFARVDGAVAGYSWVWEVKSVNSKGLDLRFRLPNGFDQIEAGARKLAGESFVRGNLSINLNLQRPDRPPVLEVNREVLDQMVALATEYKDGAGNVNVETLLGLRGVVDVVEGEDEDEAEIAQRDAAITVGFGELMTALATARREEGARMGAVVDEHIEEISSLISEAAALAEMQPVRRQERLAAQLDELLGSENAVSPERLAQELALIISKGDVREELDRLVAHVGAARDLMAESGAVGRRLDFLCQEFNREANTLCSKSSDLELTRIGLALKAAIERLREQIQNIE
ncbi:MAG: YicC family protein [Rhodospirillaceae bacterium]|nr:YicC family protein [Rhodospirillaceae bacterium]